MTGAGAGRSTSQPPLGFTPDFQRVKQEILQRTGLHYYRDRDDALAAQIRRQSLALDMDEGEYCRRLLRPEGEEAFALLTNEIAIGETYFFRYPRQLEALRTTIVPRLLARNREERRLAIWSAGCSSGAEPYTLSILLQSDFASQLDGWRVSILGTDINRQALDQARTGLYSNWELRTAGDDLRQRYFTPVAGKWSLRPQYRRQVEFAHQNLAADIDAFARQWAGAFDIILCRNVMIYFAPPLIRRLLRCFGSCLAPGGSLLVGHAEPYFEIANVLAPEVVDGTTVWRRQGGPGRRAQRADGPVDAPVNAPVDAHVDAPAAASEPAFAPDTVPAGPTPVASPAAPSTGDTGPAGPPADVAGALAAVRRHAETGDWAAALAACTELVARFPLSPGGHYTCALVAEHAGAADLAEPALRRAIYLDRGFALAHYHLGRCQLQRGDRTAAARSFANALSAVAGKREDDPLALGEGLTAADLRALVAIHAEMLGRPQSTPPQSTPAHS